MERGLVAALIVVLSVAVVAPPVAAQRYERLTVRTNTVGSDAPAFRAFIAELRRAARGRDFAAVERHVAPDFRWLRDFGGGFEANVGAVTNFRRAMDLGPDEALGDDARWGRLRELLAADAFGGSGDAAQAVGAGALCGPVEPEYDHDALDRIAQRTHTDVIIDWAFVRGRTPVRAAARSNARVIEVVGDIALRVHPDPHVANTPFISVTTPSGRRGFVPTRAVQSFTAMRLCFARGPDGRWRIAAFVGGGD